KPIAMADLEGGVKALLADIHKALHDRQVEFVKTRVKHPKTLDEAKQLDGEAQKAGVGYILTMAICSDSCAAQVEKGLDIKTLGVPAGVDRAQNVGGTCAVCGKHAKDTLRFARTY
ncbi:MAG: prolyl-tRNA synthetase, partial [Thermoplasmata archaeon]|nr:prolyl-tRNA synthetase [Thermoplasmata archaeon]